MKHDREGDKKVSQPCPIWVGADSFNWTIACLAMYVKFKFLCLNEKFMLLMHKVFESHVCYRCNQVHAHHTEPVLSLFRAQVPEEKLIAG